MIDTRCCLPLLLWQASTLIPVFLLAFPEDTGAADFDKTVRTATQYLAPKLMLWS